MNYQDFYIRRKKNSRSGKPFSENVEEKELLKGMNLEDEACDDGLPKVGGVLDTEHDGRPIHLSKIIQIGKSFGSGASGNTSGYSEVGEGDTEPITAGGRVDAKIASKSVGSDVAPGEGQKQIGPNHKGHIANTPRNPQIASGRGDDILHGEEEGLSLQEAKKALHKVVKEALKEIVYDKKSGKWVHLNESHDAAGFPKGGVQGRPQYKVVNPQYRTVEEVPARTNQYDPEITEMYDEEEEGKMDERFNQLMNAQRNLNEEEMTEMKKLRETIERLEEKKKKKFLQKAIKKSHKGFCTPMSKKTCTPHRKALAKRLKPGGDLYKGHKKKEINEGQCEDFPCCGHGYNQHGQPDCPDRDPETGEETWSCSGCGGKLPKNAQSSLCQKCQRRMQQSMDDDPTGQDLDNLFGGEDMGESTVNMKMGPSYKKVQPQLAQDSDDDFARKNQYDPEITENDRLAEIQGYEVVGWAYDGDLHCPDCAHKKFGNKLNNEENPPEDSEGNPIHPLFASDVEGGEQCGDCGQPLMGDDEMDESGGSAVQHSSFRTTKDMPQLPKNRHRGDIDENKAKKKD